MKSDLTRWNRAGLKRFRYVDGNAATYLEALRQELFARLEGWDRELLGIDPEKREEEFREYLALFGEDHLHALDNYLSLNDNRGSIALEMVRSFARAAHVLTEHLDAYANEGYLGTATQWENVRRLVYGLDYHPTPPASAMTYLILDAKPEQSGLVARGQQIKHTPEDKSPVVFETLEDIEIDPALNVLRLKDWDHVQEDAVIQDGRLTLNGIVEGLKKGDPVIIENAQGLLPCLLDEGTAIEGRNTVLNLDLSSLDLSSLNLPPGNDLYLGPRGDVTVHLKPVEKLEVYGPTQQQVLKAGDSTLFLKEESVPSSTQIKEGNYVFIGNGITGHYRTILKLDGKQIRLDSGAGVYSENQTLSEENHYVGEPEILTKFLGAVTLPITGEDRPLADILKEEEGIESQFIILNNPTRITVLGDKTWLEGGDILLQMKNNTFKADKVTSATPTTSYNSVTTTVLTIDNPSLADITSILLPPRENQWKCKIDSFIDMSQKSVRVVDTVKRIARGDLCVAVCGSNLVSARVLSVSEEEAGRSDLEVDNWKPMAPAENFLRNQTAIFGKFKEQFSLKESDVNEGMISGSNNNSSSLPEPENVKTAISIRMESNAKEMISGNNKSGGSGDSGDGSGDSSSGGGSSFLELEYVKAAMSLKTGRLIVIEQEAPKPRRSFLTSITSINASNNGVVITLDPPLPDGYTIGRTVIRANVVPAGHGETQPERILGSGNATLSNQEFLFPVSDVSFVSDPAQDSGVRADIDIVVDGAETWMQVSRFNQSRATDPHYLVRMTEDGHLRIVFGDGINGRRLPTGENNVRIAWRLGSGSAGNLDAGSFKKLAQPHPRVEAIDQPFTASGGDDKESVTSLRRSAPGSLLTMQRAVSTVDFAELAASRPGIWDARAIHTSSGREQGICVTIVPAEGRLPLAQALSDDLRAFLLARAIPGVCIELKNYEPELLKLKITLGINTRRFDVDDVKAEVRKTLLDRFTLKNRSIGSPVYLSDIYQCVEAVRGIEYSVCNFMLDEDRLGEQHEVQSLEPESDHGVLYLEDDSEDNIRLTVDKWEESQ